ncbi:MAG: tetratricopeptide repeat protein [Candidatus Omnitrophica bacterium]|nr:tetratricopeptide repeat protein [Candidatus Omnitrophota bacterium]
MKWWVSLPVVHKKFLAIIFLIIATLLLYSSLFQADYLNWDDKAHVLENPLITKPQGSFLWNVFTEENTANGTYIPLTAASFFLEKQIFGFVPAISHAINLFLHICNVILILVLGQYLGLSFLAAYGAAVLFSIHPMHVESVAWVTERKDVLYSFLYLSSLILYCRFQDTGQGKLYIWALLLAVGSVFSKPMALSLPLVLFLIDFIRNKPLNGRTLLQKLPFAAAVFMIAGITFVLNSRPVDFTLPSSLLIWLWSAFFYIKTFFLPIALSPIYDIARPVSILNPEYWIAVLGVTGLLTVLCFNLRARWLIFALGFYVFSAFFLWRFDVFDPAIVADRFMYLPSLGICFFLAYVLERFLVKGRIVFNKPALFVLLAVFIVLGVTTVRQLCVWRNSWTLWSRVLELRPDLYFAHYMRSQSLADNNFNKETDRYFEQFILSKLSSVLVTPDEVVLVRSKLPYFKSLLALRWLRRDLARPLWKKSMFQEVGLDLIYKAYIDELLFIGNYRKALDYIQKKAMHVFPTGEDYVVMGGCYTNLRLYSKAFEALTKAVQVAPNNYNAYLARGSVSVLMGDIKKAFSDVEHLMRIDPKASDGYDLLFNMLVSLNRLPEARQVLDRERVLFLKDPQVLRHAGIYSQQYGKSQ